VIALDSSALIAILLHEPEADMLVDAIERADRLLIGAPTLLECRIVAAVKSPRLPGDLRELIDGIRPETIDFTARHLEAATDAFERFGKGRHSAALNFGDCMAYAVARVAGCPLLYKGQDFAWTDIRSAR
jgi:ribonuclease VapC